jgi:phenylacetate-coenzyme A ligase PaaK-like adenylate-forming protein
VKSELFLLEALEPAEVARFVRDDGRLARISARAVAMTSARSEAILRELRADAARIAPAGQRVRFTGLVPVFAQMEQYLVKGQLASYASAIALVALVFLLLHRSFWMTAVALVVNVAPIGPTTAAMALLGVRLDVATIMVASIALGIVVDDTIHVLHAWRRGLELRGSAEGALEYALGVAGRPTILTAVILVGGFGMLTLSDFQPPRTSVAGRVHRRVALAVELIGAAARARLARAAFLEAACESWNRDDSLARSVSCAAPPRARRGPDSVFERASRRGARSGAPVRGMPLLLPPATGRRRMQIASTVRKLTGLAVTRVAARLLGAQLRGRSWPSCSACSTTYENVPLYREKLDKANLRPVDLESLADLARFPITEKDEIRDSFPRGCVAIGTDLSRCRIQQTSGSSGQCMEIALDVRSDDLRTLFTQRVYGLQGFTFWRRMAYLFPYELPLRKGNAGLYRNRWFSTKLAPAAILEGLRAWRPHLLAATPSDLLELCDGLDDDLRELGLQAICVHPSRCRRTARHVAARFGCRSRPTTTAAGLGDRGGCRSGRLHQFPTTSRSRSSTRRAPCRAASAGRARDVAAQYVQPFIRYRLGDIAAWEPDSGPCRCGLDLPRLRALEGRDDDYLEYPDGRRMHPARITVAVKSPCFEFPGEQIFRDYRITQDGPAHVTVQIVPGRDASHLRACAEAGRQNLSRLLGAPFRVDLQVLTALPRGSGGKRKIVERTLSSGGAGA